MRSSTMCDFNLYWPSLGIISDSISFNICPIVTPCDSWEAIRVTWEKEIVVLIKKIDKNKSAIPLYPVPPESSGGKLLWELMLFMPYEKAIINHEADEKYEFKLIDRGIYFL